MGWTFGAGTGDDASLNITSVGASGTIAYGSCWVYPTTLTATRSICSVGAVWVVQIDTTTSELRLITDNTTDGQWTTTGAGLALNTWTFLAWIASPLNTGPVCAWRVWAGTLNTPPTELTVTNAVAPVGNFTGGTTLTWGNRGGSGTVAFQGQLENCVFGAFNGTISDRLSPFTIAAAGTITQIEADFIRDRYVRPNWKGDLYPQQFISNLPPANSGLNWYVMRMNLGAQSLMEHAFRAAVGNPVGGLTQLNGATASGTRVPIPALGSHVTFRPLHRLR